MGYFTIVNTNVIYTFVYCYKCNYKCKIAHDLLHL